MCPFNQYPENGHQCRGNHPYTFKGSSFSRLHAEHMIQHHVCIEKQDQEILRIRISFQQVMNSLSCALKDSPSFDCLFIYLLADKNIRVQTEQITDLQILFHAPRHSEFFSVRKYSQKIINSLASQTVLLTKDFNILFLMIFSIFLVDFCQEFAVLRLCCGVYYSERVKRG